MRSLTRTPRLLVLTPDFPPTPGGIQLLTHRIATGVAGLDTRVLALEEPGAASFDARGDLAVRRVRADGRLGSGRMVALNAAAVSEARRFRPDVTLSMHVVASPAAALIRRALGARTVQYFHANEIGGKPRLTAFAARRANVAVAVSSYTAGLIAATGVVPAQLRVIPPGVDLPSDPTVERGSHAQPHTARPTDGAEVPQDRAELDRAVRSTLLTIARLKDSYKGHDVLLRALALVRERVPDVKLVVIGDGPLRGDLERLAGAMGVGEAVSFLGAVSDEQRDRWLRRADVFAMPSRLPLDGLAGEGFGIVYLEAAAHGMPVVAGDVGGALDAVADGVTGLLVDPTDPRAVADALIRLLLDRELARRLGRAGAERAKGFAWSLIAARVQEVLLEQVSRRDPGRGRGT
ncbi:MAG TPA: glycosyltransferase family 4 protein [Solirubrobacteraceae bacterium]|nr:glycosyltransferase family 4 protein [Solirubrobacteraceae bacterium]